MSIETRSAVAEQARVYAFVGLLAMVGCWIGFAHQLHVELGDPGGDDEFGAALALWLAGGVVSTVLMAVTGLMAWLHRYFEAAVASEAAARPDAATSGV